MFWAIFKPDGFGQPFKLPARSPLFLRSLMTKFCQDSSKVVSQKNDRTAQSPSNPQEPYL